VVGPRNLVHCTASDTDDPTVDPRWGVVGKQKIVDEGPLAPGPDTGRTPYGGTGEGVAGAKYDMTTFDEVLVKRSIDFMKKAKDEGKPFFLWHNTTRMHVWTFLSEKYKAMMNPETNYGMEEAGMAQLDDNIGALLKALDDMGIADNTIVVFSTDNGAEVFTWPDGGMTPFRGTKGTAFEGGFRVPAIIRWPGKVPAGKVENGLFSGLDWFPSFVAAAGNPNIVDELKAGKDLGGTTYKVHLDGYNQLDLLTGKGPTKRQEIWYFVETNLGGLRLGEFKYRFFDQPDGWPGPKVPINMPILVNLKQDPFERGPVANLLMGAPAYMNEFFAREFWRFVYVQQKVGELATTAIDFPPMQKGASFNLQAVKEQIEAAIAKGHPGE
jgi:arylsulfatase